MVNYVRELSEELAKVGVSGRLRRRIVTELADHLHCDPRVDLGEPAELAHRFADELGTRRATRAAYASFGALALAGTLFAVVFLTSGSAGPNATHVYASSALVGYLGVALVLLAPQVAFVAGLLALVRTFRHRNDDVLARSNAVLIGRRAAVGVGAGFATMVGLVLIAVEFEGELAGWWTRLALCTAVAGTCGLVAATPAVLAALRLKPVAGGRVEDLFDDLAGLVPRPLRGRPWALAAAVSVAVALIIAAAGALLGDPVDGALRGAADGFACLIGFTALGRYLGLRAETVT